MNQEPIDRWRGRLLRITKHARDELLVLSIDTYDLIRVLDESVPCPRSRRGRETYEYCTKIHGKEYKIVIIDDIWRAFNEPCWTVKHIKRYNWGR